MSVELIAAARELQQAASNWVLDELSLAHVNKKLEATPRWPLAYSLLRFWLPTLDTLRNFFLAPTREILIVLQSEPLGFEPTR